MGRREAPLEARAVKWARFQGIVTAKLTGCDGIPDRVFFVPGGRPVVGEFKAEGAGSHGTRAATQPWYLEKLRADGYDAHKWDTWEKFIDTMKGRGYGK